MQNAYERIYRIWSDRVQDEVSLRVRFSIEAVGPCRVVVLGEREQWR